MKIIFIPFNKKMIVFISSSIIILGLLLLLFFFNNNAITTFNPNPIYECDSGRPEIALTCNVVWGTEFIQPMLEILKEKNVKITFFIGGKWAEDNSELLKAMQSQGHQIGNHGYDHKKHSQLNDEENKKEILQAEKVINQTIDFKTNFFAPPYGDINDKTVEIAEKLGYRVIMWSIDTIDWKYKDANIIYDRVMKKDLEGQIVLMHPTQATVEALPKIIDGIKEKKVNLVTVSDLLNK